MNNKFSMYMYINSKNIHFGPLAVKVVCYGTPSQYHPFFSPKAHLVQSRGLQHHNIKRRKSFEIMFLKTSDLLTWLLVIHFFHTPLWHGYIYKRFCDYIL